MPAPFSCLGPPLAAPVASGLARAATCAEDVAHTIADGRDIVAQSCEASSRPGPHVRQVFYPVHPDTRARPTEIVALISMAQVTASSISTAMAHNDASPNEHVGSGGGEEENGEGA
jgi:hypothetical protein